MPSIALVPKTDQTHGLIGCNETKCCGGFVGSEFESVVIVLSYTD